MADKQISNAKIKEAWLNQSLTSLKAAVSVGLSRAALWRRAKELGLPKRKNGRRIVVDIPLFTRLWNEGCSATDIARICGCHFHTINRTVHRLGLVPRPSGGFKSPTPISVVIEKLQKERLASQLKGTKDV